MDLIFWLIGMEFPEASLVLFKIYVKLSGVFSVLIQYAQYVENEHVSFAKCPLSMPYACQIYETFLKVGLIVYQNNLRETKDCRPKITSVPFLFVYNASVLIGALEYCMKCSEFLFKQWLLGGFI